MDWHFPAVFRFKSKQLHRVFSEYRDHTRQENSKLNASASEVLGLYSLLRHYVDTHIEGHDVLANERDVFDAACAIVDISRLGFTSNNVFYDACAIQSLSGTPLHRFIVLRHLHRALRSIPALFY